MNWIQIARIMFIIQTWILRLPPVNYQFDSPVIGWGTQVLEDLLHHLRFLPVIGWGTQVLEDLLHPLRFSQ
jgi:hypothetical protein